MSAWGGRHDGQRESPRLAPPAGRYAAKATGIRAPWVTRLIVCLLGGVVLAMMVGTQEGSNVSYSYGFRQSVLQPRIFIFLGIGVLLFLAITFRPISSSRT